MNCRFHHLHLLCSDLERSIDFFVRILGADLVARKTFANADGAVLDLNQTMVNLRVPGENETVDPDTCPLTYGYHHMCVEVDDVDAACRELIDKGIEILTPPKDIPGNLRVAFFSGPDDIVIEVLQQR